MFVGFCQSGSILHMMRIFKMSAKLSVIHIIKNYVLYVICRSFILCLNILKVRKNWQSIFQKEKKYLLCQHKCQKYVVINVWRKSVFDIYFNEFVAALKTVLPVLFKYCYKYCYSDSRRLWAVMNGEVWRFKIWFNPPFL